MTYEEFLDELKKKPTYSFLIRYSLHNSAMISNFRECEKALKFIHSLKSEQQPRLFYKIVSTVDNNDYYSECIPLGLEDCEKFDDSLDIQFHFQDKAAKRLADRIFKVST